MHSPFSRLPGETPPPLGHNGGPPLDAAQSWRAHCWSRARKALMGHVPLEMVRMRMRRAQELGLDYPAYASILTGTGRDVVAFLFTTEALGLRLQRSVTLPETTRAKLAALRGCDRLLMTDRDADPDTLARALEESWRLPFAGAARGPGGHAGLPAGRAAIRALLDPLRLPGDAVVMVGTRAEERAWADAARMAKFLPATGYFPAPGS